jgi:hypothetical protein
VVKLSPLPATRNQFRGRGFGDEYRYFAPFSEYRIRAREFDVAPGCRYDLPMPSVHPVAGVRQHPRAQLSLPARVRWRGPLGMRLEAVRTIDISREGFLIRRAEPCHVGARVWIAFPYDAAVPNLLEPEMAARILRVEEDCKGGYRIALRLESTSRGPTRELGGERREVTRVSASLPIVVRPAGFPFPEESMTQDASRCGARFETLHNYTCGDEVLAQFPWSGWTQTAEIPARVVRIEIPTGTTEGAAEPELASVAIRWLRPPR